MIDDEARMRIAANLRLKSGEMRQPCMCVEQMEGCWGDKWAAEDMPVHDIEDNWERAYLRGIVDCVPDGKSIFDVLADLIERPTCFNDGGRDIAFSCSRCGYGSGELFGALYCPACGAKVVWQWNGAEE